VQRRRVASRIRLVCLICLICLVGASPASAQDPSAPETPPDSESTGSRPENLEATEEARQRFESGMRLYDARSFRDAIREFELAARLVPSADLWFNIARAHEELSELDLAIEYYGRYLRDRVDPPDRGQIEAHLVRLRERATEARAARRERPRTGTLRIQSSEAGAEVRLDDRSLGRAPLAAPLTLEPGVHRLEVRREGFLPFRAEVRVEAGLTIAAYAELIPRRQVRAVRGSRIWTWIVGGLAVASLATSVVFGVMTAGADGDQARTHGAVSDGFLGAGIGLSVGAIALYFLEGRAISTEITTAQ
jgi:hypothetical protein